MYYNMIKPLRLYKGQSSLVLPKGERTGYENVVFLASPTKQSADTLLTDKFLEYQVSLYKHYIVDFVYNERIGNRNYVKNNSGIFKKEFSEIPFEGSIRQVIPANKKTLLLTRPNLLVNLGEWLDVYFRLIVNTSTEKVCENFINFLSKRINDSMYSSYDKIVYIDIWQWFGGSSRQFGLGRKELDNPISILLVTLYKYPELIRTLGVCTLLLSDSHNQEFLQLRTSDFTKDSYGIIKSRILSMAGIANNINPESVNIEDSKNDTELTPEENAAKDANLQNLTKTDIMKRKIISSLKRNLVGNVEDITTDFNDADDEIFSSITVTTSDEDAEIENTVNKYIDENPDLLDVDQDLVLKEIEEVVKRKHFVAKFTPERTNDTMNRIRELSNIQESVLGLPSFEDLRTKIIDETDLTDCVKTKNPNIVKSKFMNFDRNYNEKKMEKDIDECVSALSQAEFKVFVTEKTAVDTSTQLDFKKTITYKLQDENGKKMELKLDIPLVIDNNYVFLNGGKKVLPHQLILKPIVKTKKDTVQIVTSLNKVFVTRKGREDTRTTSLYKYLIKNAEEYSVKTGNGSIMNRGMVTSVEFDMIGKLIYEFEIENCYFTSDINKLLAVFDKFKIKYSHIDQNTQLIIGYDKSTKKAIYIDKVKDSYSEKIISYLPESGKEEVSKSVKYKKNRRLLYNQCKIMGSYIPVVLFTLYCEGLKSVMDKAGIEYKFVSIDDIGNIDPYIWGTTELEDGYLVWKRYPIENSLLMNGLNVIPTEIYSFNELDSQDTYIYMLSQFYANVNMKYNLDQFKDFMIDNITKEILMDYHLPTDIVSIFLYANKLLADNDFKIESDLSNMRVRSNEIIAGYTYEAVTSAYRQYRKTQHKKNPTKISLKGNEVLLKIKTDTISEDDSVLNPILQLSKTSSATYKGHRGIGMDDAMTLDKRAYNASMIGILGITTSPDAGVGVNRNLTFEPNITSTRGYLEITPRKDVDQLTSANLLTAAEMLTPLGVQHDDPARTAMSYKQSMYMLMVADSDPVMIGNGVEKIIPYRMSNDFTVVAKDNGTVVDIKGSLITVQYADGKYQTIDTSRQVKRNSASGFYIVTQLTCEKKVGDTVKKGEVFAWDTQAFKKNTDDLSASMKLGTLVKVAVLPEWDIFEDSAPLSTRASKKMTSVMGMDEEVTLNKGTHVYKMAQIGDEVKTGDTLIKFDQAHDDADTQAYFETLRKTLSQSELDEMIDANSTTKKSKYTGRIIDIKIYSTVDIDQLSPSLQKIVKEYYKKISIKEEYLTKYSNPDDTKYYKSGQLVIESATKIETDYQGKAKGATIGEGVLIIFYIEFEDRMARGDKLAAEFALKSINSHVITEGLEPYSEFNPDEIIDLISAPLSISARKTPTIFIAMFGNKCIIEAKRHLKRFWYDN